MSESRAAAIARLQPWVDRAREFSGWDLSLAEPRQLDPGPPWDYEALARDLLKSADRVLDIGTGGGEVLSRLLEGSSARCIATEQWHVNAPVADERLRPLGVDLVQAESLRLPFPDEAFDVILSRHEEFDPPAVAAMVKPGGTLLTQQVGDDNWHEIGDYFPRWVVFDWVFSSYVEGLRSAGLEVESRQHRYRVAYPSLGHLSYLLAIMPWQLPDFDLESDLEALLALEQGLSTPDGIVLTESRDLIVARKP